VRFLAVDSSANNAGSVGAGWRTLGELDDAKVTRAPPLVPLFVHICNMEADPVFFRAKSVVGHEPADKLSFLARRNLNFMHVEARCKTTNSDHKGQ
jgi:hypothetical protein